MGSMDQHPDKAQGKADGTPWRRQWKTVLQMSAGAAPHLKEGWEYVEDLRRTDAERLSRLAP